MEEPKVPDDRIEKCEDQSSESQKEVSVDSIEYPTKSKLIMIVVALMLSMFLVRANLHSSHGIHCY